MISEIQTAQKDIGERISNVVLMGMGEPLDNYKNVLRFLELVSSENGLNIGSRIFCFQLGGLVMKKFTTLPTASCQLTLSVSLHAPNDEIRSRTMPVNLQVERGAALKSLPLLFRRNGPSHLL